VFITLVQINQNLDVLTNALILRGIETDINKIAEKTLEKYLTKTLKIAIVSVVVKLKKM
jgi:histidinol phosphatase-like PHP family hydrolase